MERAEAVAKLKSELDNINLFKHCLATEAVMRALAKRLGEDEKEWAMAGLLHDIDLGRVKDNLERHSLLSAEMVEEMGFGDDMVDAVRAHNEKHGFPRETRMAKALYACDPLTGLIVAGALIHPSKKLSSIDTKFIMNRYREKSFARGANRQVIESCSELGLDLEDFVTTGLEAMQGIAADLGL
ncbi:MAG: HDIG domain-containing protein [Firmicutes bacterium]|nr:HDIG domain-containing protein [Bacillota bacterium]